MVDRNENKSLPSSNAFMPKRNWLTNSGFWKGSQHTHEWWTVTRSHVVYAESQQPKRGHGPCSELDLTMWGGSVKR